MFPCDFLENFKNTFSTKHLRTTASLIVLSLIKLGNRAFKFFKSWAVLNGFAVSIGELSLATENISLWSIYSSSHRSPQACNFIKKEAPTLVFSSEFR